MEPDSVDRYVLIAIQAYRYWEERGRPIGSPEVDWFQAEQELRLSLDSQSLPLSSLSMEAVTN